MVKSPLIDEKKKMSLLPIDAVVEILKRLRNKPLFRFKCVCKQWNHLISQSWFIKMRHKYKTSRRRQLCFIYVSSHHHQIENDNCQNVNGGCGFRFTTADTQGNIIDEFSLPVPEIGCTFPWVLATQLELVCFFKPFIDPKTYLFNPTTKQILHLPPGSRCEYHRNNDIQLAIGFGYSTRTDEYKVVHIYFTHFSSERGRFPVRDVDSYKISCEIYSLEEIVPSSSNSNGCWKTINDRCPCPIQTPASCIDDALHWLSDIAFETNVAVVSFNLNTENFSIVPSTQQWQDMRTNGEGELILLIFGKRLSVGNLNETRIRIWMLKDYNQGVWEEAYTISLVNVVDKEYMLPVFMDDDELLIATSHLNHTYYDTKAQTFRTTKMLRPRTNFGFYLK